MDTSPHQSDFISVNGIHLHYLDWGGNGQVLLFLAGMGCSAHIFDRFAPRFVDKFHVLALTRRGHGESDYPETGYDIDMLTEDVRQFMDALEIKQVILVGHSLAGVELSHFAALYPQRVLKLVYLDAAFDYASPAYQAMQARNPLRSLQPPGINADHYSIENYVVSLRRAYPGLAAIWNEVFDKMSTAIEAGLREMLNTYSPEFSQILAPVLSFFALQDSANYLSSVFMSAEQQAQVVEFFNTLLIPYTKDWIEQYRRMVPHAKIVEIPKGHHYCFMKQEELVFEEMRRFLLEDD
jgi:non-heme chloroperoxidase